MKKLLVLMGSPRKGETYKAAQMLGEAFNKIEPVELEYIFLNKVGFGDCLGCHNCILKGEDRCYQKDLVQELYSRIEKADGIILASPVYNQHVTAIMKRFLDYFTYLWHRPALFGKVFFGVSSGGGMFKDVFKLMKTNVESWGGVWAGSLGIPHYEALTPKFQQKVDADVPKKAEIFVKAMNATKLPSPSFGQLMMFNVWKMNAVACKDSNPKDYAFWTQKELFDKAYYYKTKIGFFKGLAVKLTVMLARFYMKKVYVGY
ncbi:MAG: NAD(P)H-dependent oxidoreductase [Clostridia bacterium]|nr:NAD(P)H-dependent oxidoreductase [Clostridia bacterium]